MLCWVMEGAPDDWPVVVWNTREGIHRYDTGAVDLLYGYLSGTLRVELLREPLGEPWFEQFRQRIEVIFGLYGGTSSFQDVLRGLRDALAPTADRSLAESYEDEGQVEFKVVDRDWMVVYNYSDRYHSVWFQVPPEDEADASAVAHEIFSSMGWQLRTAR
jgi:hypothetical protein